MTERGPELPAATVVDRDRWRRAAGSLAQALVGGVFTMWSELLAAMAAAFPLMRADRHAGPGLADAVAVALLGGLLFMLVRRIARPSILSVRTARAGEIEYASTSWVHAALDLLYAAGGVSLLVGSRWIPGPDFDPGFAIGAGLAAVPGLLLALRLAYGLRRRSAAP